MSNLDVVRSVRFVSLDTHPASNSLVVTYEILVTINDAQSKHELSRRTKRDQLLISISELDKMGVDDYQKSSNSSTVNLGELAQAIIKECPLLEQLDNSQALEEIQLHLLYLFNRRRSQIYQASQNADRPPSAASGRRRSATPTGSGARLSSARQLARDGRRPSMSNRGEQPACLDCYATLYEDELRAGRGCGSSCGLEEDLREEFLQQLQKHLSSFNSMHKHTIDRNLRDQSGEIDAQLEGLYGDLEEKITAMQSVSRLVQDDQKLVTFEPDRLLVSAILRTLQDSEARDARLSGLILYCLVRFTQFPDVYDRVLNRAEPIDLVRVLVDLLEEQSRLASKSAELRPVLDQFYHLNSALVILGNLVRLDELNDGRGITKKLVQSYGKRVASNLIGLYVMIARHLARDLRNQSSSRYERLTLVLANVISLTRSLACFREFVNLLRAQSQTMTESLISCINTLQLSRPGSGSIQQSSDPSKEAAAKQAPEEQFFVKDRLILCEIYKLEMDLVRLINILIYDTRFKLRFSRKSLLLKCVLRNLIVFLASSRRSNTLVPYDRASVLLVPFKCLYELSCQQSTMDELFKSKIVLKCLLEFLLSSTSDLKTVLDSFASMRTKEAPRGEKNSLEDDQIILDARNASHYITAIWINLSAKGNAPFYSLQVDRELSEPIADYIGLANVNVESFADKMWRKTLANKSSAIFQEAQLDLYLHAKLLRNLSQFLKFHQDEPLVWCKQYGGWLKQQSRSLDQLLNLVRVNAPDPLLLPLTVECIATLTNLIAGADSLWTLDDEVSGLPVLDWPQELSCLLKQVIDINLTGALSLEGGDNDDLLLVSINLIGALARSVEICSELKECATELLVLCNLVLETKNNDVEMIVSCLFTLCHLLNHWTFLKLLCSRLEDKRPEEVVLLERVSCLVMHGEPAIVKLSSVILNCLKQFEEQQSLADSVACRQRFVSYNDKWLKAIRANRDEPGASPTHSLDQREPELDVDDEFGPLRAVALNEQSACVSRMSTSSSSRSSALPGEQALPFGPASKSADRLKDVELEEEDDLESAEREDEETFSEPDLNVIDANSMIKHLTTRREFRAELMAMNRA